MRPAGGGAAMTAIAASAVIWGLWWLPLRWLDAAGLTGNWTSLAVYGSAAGLLAPIAWARRERLRAGGTMLLVTGALFGASLVLWNHAVLTGHVVRVVLLFYLAPVWATLLDALVLRVAIGPLRVLAVALGLSGAALVLGGGGGIPWPRDASDWLAVLSGLLFALSATAARKSPTVGSLEKTFVSLTGAALVALLLVGAAAAAPGGPTGRMMLDALPLAALAAVVWILPLSWLVLLGAGRLDPGRVSILLLLEVVVSAASASLLTDEPFGWREAGGCVLIMLAAVAEAAPGLRRSGVG